MFIPFSHRKFCPPAGLLEMNPEGPWGMQSSLLYHPRREKEPAMLLGQVEAPVAIFAAQVRSWENENKITLAAKIWWEVERNLKTRSIKIMPRLWVCWENAIQCNTKQLPQKSLQSAKCNWESAYRTHLCHSHDAKLLEGVLGWMKLTYR